MAHWVQKGARMLMHYWSTGTGCVRVQTFVCFWRGFTTELSALSHSLRQDRVRIDTMVAPTRYSFNLTLQVYAYILVVSLFVSPPVNVVLEI